MHEKMGTDGENIQLDISGKYPCSFQGNIIRFIEFKIENDQSLVQFFCHSSEIFEQDWYKSFGDVYKD